MSRPQRVAVLGAGIMGASLALFLARKGVPVTLIDREALPMAATSRWNEGKIHLGYLYGADSSLRTARHMLPGALQFGPLVSELIESDVSAHSTSSDDTYLVHRRSVVDASALRVQFEAVSDLVREHPDASRYLVDVSDARAVELSPTELSSIATTDVVAGWRVPERSVDTRWVADRLAEAVAAERHISMRMETTITEVQPLGSGHGMRILAEPDLDETFDVVVNALWNGRLAFDITAGLVPEYAWSHRYRLCLFIRTRDIVDVPSAIVAVGPFGDVKNYDGRTFYVSWYPVGLVAEGTDVTLPAPEPLSSADREAFITGVRGGLETVLPDVGRILDAADEVTIAGGFVFAQGTGSIGDRRSSLHRRDRYGVQRLGSYFSVDTGKYATAPWLAHALAKRIWRS